MSINHLILLSVFILLISCKKEEESALAGCCDNPAINEAVGNGHVYVPNIFTPNFDGINDELILFGDSIHIIRLMEVRNKMDEVIFSATNFTAGMAQMGWDGEINGEVVKGIYDVKVEVESTDGTVKTLYGKVCNHPCEESGENLLDNSTCQYPIQNDGGHHNPQFPSGEISNCFE